MYDSNHNSQSLISAARCFVLGQFGPSTWSGLPQSGFLRHSGPQIHTFYQTRPAHVHA
jgi:hypothetical protein